MLLLLSALALAAAPDRAGPPPRGNWSVDYGETACLAVRRFGTGDDTIVLALRPSLNSETMRISVAKPGHYIAAQHASIRLGEEQVSGLLFWTKQGSRRVVSIDLPPAQFARVAAQPRMPITTQRFVTDLALDDMPTVLAALEKCRADLKNYWNATPSGAAKIATAATPITPLASLFRPSDFPVEANIPRAGGRVALSLMVDEKGAVKDCILDENSGDATLDAQTCIVVAARARYRPARDTAGKAVKSIETARFTWMPAK